VQSRVWYALRLYLHFFNNYSATYGSLAAVILVLLWFYLTGAALLIGGEINSEVEHAAAAHRDVPSLKRAPQPKAA
jgi:membrane protein